jgi:hypothetical protein
VIITEVGVLRQEKNWLFLVNFIIFVVKDFDETNSDEIHFFNNTFMLNDSSSRSVDSTVKIDDNLVDKSSLTFFEEMVE